MVRLALARRRLFLHGSAIAFPPIRTAVVAQKLGAVVIETTPTIRTAWGIGHRSGSLNPAAWSFVLQSKTAYNRWVERIRQHQGAGEPLLKAALLADENLHEVI